MNPITHDVVVYAATPAGVAAGVTAAQRGAKVVLIEPHRHVGGLSTSGLNTSEAEHMLPESWGGVQEALYRRIGGRYGIDGPLHRWESHVAEQAMLEMLDEAGVEVVYDGWIDSASVEDGRITALTTTDGRTFAGRVFIDCSYEGDLAHCAGVSMTFGREAIDAYGESLAGQRFIERPDEVANTKGDYQKVDELIEARTVDADGNLLPLFTPMSEITLGAGDGRVMNYNFRVTVSTADDRVPFTAPEGYDPADFANVATWLAGAGGKVLGDVIDVYNHPSGQYHRTPDGFARPIKTHKWELNNKQAAVWSLGHFGAQFGWPDGTHEQRRAIWAEHKRHNLGLLYFLASDAAVPAKLREDARRYGLAADEYADNDHWPYQLYVREARRMVGDWVMTQRDVLDDRDKSDVIMRGSHWIDCHHVQRIAVDANHFRNEGRIWKQVERAYDIPYRVLLPSREQVSNLLVPVAVSASHVAYCSIRLESVWMLLGQAAGDAAVGAVAADAPVQSLDIAALQRRLTEGGVKLGQSAKAG